MAVRTPIIAIVGRPNVGKSTLFNRIVGARRALVEDEPGVTRDRNYALIERYSVAFHLVDTGGFEVEPEEEIGRQVAEQAVIAAEEADIVIALFDGKAGLHPGDEDVVRMLRQYSKPILFAVNKCDGFEQSGLAADFYALGLDHLHTISALHGRGVREFVELALRSLPNYQSLLTSKGALEAKQAELARALAEAAEAEAAAATESGESEDADLDQPTGEELHEEFGDPQSAGAAADYFVDFNDSDAASFDQARRANESYAGRPAAASQRVQRFAPVFLPSESLDAVDEQTLAREALAYDREHRLLPIPESQWKERPVSEKEQEPVLGEDYFVAAESTLPECIRVAIIGRPNAGKSTLLNTLLGENKVVTSPLAGTTRDALYFRIKRNGQEYELIDTAGLRKKARVSTKIERYSTIRALGAISECDVAVVLIDGFAGPTEQDAKIVGLAHDQGKAIVIAVNKWDAVAKDHRTVHEFKKKIRTEFKFTPYAPVLFISALTGKRCPSVIDSVREVAVEQHKRVSTARLNVILKRAMKRVTAPAYRGQPVKLFYAAQVATAPPRFVLFFNFPRQVHFSYLRFIKNAIREEFGFVGSDIKLVCRRRD